MNEKPSKNLVVPSSIKDMQAILDNDIVFNRGFSSIPIICTDYVRYSDADFGSLLQEDQDAYTWKKTINYESDQSSDWTFFYRMIENANLVLDGVKEMESNHEVKFIQGQAHFFRAVGYYYLSQTFCKPYVKGSANHELGLPLRLTSNVNQVEKRSNLQQVYDLILSDLKFAIENLPNTVMYNTRASKTSALAMLAKTNLIMQDYNEAIDYANAVLQVKNELLDFNNEQLVSSSNTFAFPYLGIDNPEIIFFAMGFTGNQWSGKGDILQVEPSFYESYSEKDKRKAFYFDVTDDRINFVGSYSGDRYLFQGISTNEIYFIRSECYARLNNIQEAQDDLNLILKNRYITGEAPVIEENDKIKLLKIIFLERTKEFPRFSNIWWEDLRRLNLEPEFQRTMKRTVNGSEISLAPNDPLYIFPIPIKEISLSGIEQNKR
ncbi:MAG: hypothetical protein BGO31_07550 [Bacteroidetes bacterium 43-16]|nr:MAG: hypothetical protein BGO31_07550 [Bacteroidetes bacterium 43-16]